MWKHVEVLKPYFVYGNHSSSFLGIAWHSKVQNERCVIPVKHGLHFRGAVLPLRDPYRKFCLGIPGKIGAIYNRIPHIPLGPTPLAGDSSSWPCGVLLDPLPLMHAGKNPSGSLTPV